MFPPARDSISWINDAVHSVRAMSVSGRPSPSAMSTLAPLSIRTFAASGLLHRTSVTEQPAEQS